MREERVVNPLNLPTILVVLCAGCWIYMLNLHLSSDILFLHKLIFYYTIFYKGKLWIVT